MRPLAYCLLLTQLVSVNAMPFSSVIGSVGGALPRRDDPHATYAGEQPTDRTVYVVISLFFMMVLSLLLGKSSHGITIEDLCLTDLSGTRMGRLRRSAMMSRNITSMIVLLLYVLVFAFIFSTAIMLAGQGLYNHRLCFSATWICLILYTACKGTMWVAQGRYIMTDC
jgi:hypothetical protein